MPMPRESVRRTVCLATTENCKRLNQESNYLDVNEQVRSNDEATTSKLHIGNTILAVVMALMMLARDSVILVTKKMMRMLWMTRFMTRWVWWTQGWHILRIIFKKSSPADKIGLNWRKLDKSGEKWIKLILTIVKGCKGEVF